jgi:NAD(P)-dependent dehydrogenase (short-subunit alcohol dehydrogenase family)
MNCINFTKKTKLEADMNIIIAGASQGIGFALVKKYLQSFDDSFVVGTYRNTLNDEMKNLSKQFGSRLKWLELDISSDTNFDKFRTEILNLGLLQIDRFVNCIALLQSEGLIAERKIEEVSLENLNKSFMVNTVPTALFAKYLKEFFKHKSYSVFAAISAKVASLGDNSLGGWYSYRASKTALNMLIKNLSLEFKRLGPEKYVIAVHPGMTQTRLSEPFMKAAEKKYKIHSPTETADNLFVVFENLKPEHQGAFVNYDMTLLPW